MWTSQQAPQCSFSTRARSLANRISSTSESPLGQSLSEVSHSEGKTRQENPSRATEHPQYVLEGSADG